MNKSLTDSLEWITSAFKVQTPAADFASFGKGEFCCQQFGQKRVRIGFALLSAWSTPATLQFSDPVSSTQCVKKHRYRSEKRISAVRKMRLLEPWAWTDVCEFVSSRCLWLWLRWQVCLSPVSQTDWQDAAAAPAELSPDRGAENFPSRPLGPGGSADWKS